MKSIEFKDEQEAKVLVELINIAVQAKGLEAAEAGVYFLNKIKEAFKEEKSEVQ